MNLMLTSQGGNQFLNKLFVNRFFISSMFFVCFLVISQGSETSYLLPEFSIETKSDLEESTIELTLFKSRSQTFKRDELNQVFTNKEKVEFAAILNTLRYGRSDPMYLNGPISKEYEQIGFITIVKPSGTNSKYFIETTLDLKNWRLTDNRESFSSTIVSLYFDESEEMASFLDFERLENFNYIHVPFFRWIFYSVLAVVVIVEKAKRSAKKQQKSKGVSN